MLANLSKIISSSTGVIMQGIDRMQFPQKYRLHDSAKLLVLIGIIIGLYVHSSSQNKLDKIIKISNVYISECTEQYIEVSYTISNLSNKNQSINLFLKIKDNIGNEIATSLFNIDIKANTTENRSKLLDDLDNRVPLKEKIRDISLSVYKRKIL